MKLALGFVVVVVGAGCADRGPSYKAVASRVRPEIDRVGAGLAKIHAAIERGPTLATCARTDLVHWDGTAGNTGMIDRWALTAYATAGDVPFPSDRLYLGLDLDDRPFARIVDLVDRESPSYLLDSDRVARTDITTWFRALHAVHQVIVIETGIPDEAAGTATVDAYVGDLDAGTVTCRLQLVAHANYVEPDRYDVMERNTQTGETRFVKHGQTDFWEPMLRDDVLPKLLTELGKLGLVVPDEA